MPYTLVHTEIKTATEDLKCDAVRSYLDRNESLRKSGKSTDFKFKNDIVVIVRRKTGLIKKGDDYIYREFVDENGDIHFLQSNIDMDKVAIKNEFYNQIILNQIK